MSGGHCQHHVVVARSSDAVDDFGEAARASDDAPHVEWVVGRPQVEKWVERGLETRPGLVQIQTALLGEIGEMDGDAPGMSDDGGAVTRGNRGPGQHLGNVIGLGRSLAHHHPEGFEHTVEHLLRQGQRSGVGCHQGLAPIPGPDATRHHRLAPGNRITHRLDEDLAVTNGLDQGEHHLHLVEDRHRRDGLTHLNVDLIPGRHRHRQAAATGRGQIVDIAAGATALSDQPDRPGADLSRVPIETGEKGGGEALGAPDDTAAVGSQQPEPDTLHPLGQVGLEGHPIVTGLAEAPGEDHQGAHSLSPHRDLAHGMRRDGTDHQVRGLGQIGEGSDDVHAIHGRESRVHSPNLARETELSEVGENPSSVLGGVGGETDDGDGLGVEKPTQIAHRSWGITSEANNSRLSPSPMS